MAKELIKTGQSNIYQSNKGENAFTYILKNKMTDLISLYISLEK